MNFTSAPSLLGSIAVMSLATAAFASPLAPNSSLFPAVPEANPVGGLVIASQTLPFATGLYSGTLTSQVISGDLSNPFGGLTFTFQLTNNATSTSAINRLTVNGYTSFLIDASSNGAGGTVAPVAIDRDAGGDVVGFSFVNVLPGFFRVQPGATSSLLVLQTNATDFRSNIASLIDGTVTQVGTYSPVIPTPGAMALVGLGTLAVARRRRK